MLEVPSGAELISPGHKQFPVRIIGEDVVGVFALSRPNGERPPEEAAPPSPKARGVLVNSVGMKLIYLPKDSAGRAYRLPIECEWEFACRAGTQTVFHTGDRLSPKQANIRGDRPYLDSEDGPSLGRPAHASSFAPNAFGLHDMHGNVAERCQDFYVDRPFMSFAPSATGDTGSHDHFIRLMNLLDGAEQKAREAMSLPIDPTGPSAGETRVYRGGAFTGDVAFCRSACRRSGDPGYAYRGIGFRVVCYPLPGGGGEK